MPKYFFFDVDGTLLPFGKPMPESAIYAIKAAQALGNKCLLATGRSLAELPNLDRVEFDGFICSAGATITLDGELIYSEHIKRDEYNALFKYFKDRGFFLLSQTDRATYLSKESATVFENLLLKYIGRVVELNGLVFDEKVPENEEVKKLLFICTEDGYGVNRVREDLKESQFTIVNNTVGLPENLMAELVLSKVTKATGIERVLNYYGAKREDSVAIGDGANDIEMVSYAGIGIAMGNSTSQALLDEADFITTDIEEDGIKRAIFYALSGEGNAGRKKEG